MPSIYVASSLQNWKNAREWMQFFAQNDIDITFDWTTQAEKMFNEQGVQRDYEQTQEELRYIANKEYSGVNSAEYFLLVLPGGRGSHWEYGSFYQKCSHMTSKPIIIYNRDTHERPLSFHYCDGVQILTDESDVKSRILKYFNKI